MEVANTLSEAVNTTAGRASYDAACKRILAEREILARIMKECLEEYADCDLEDIARVYIKDDPLVESGPLHVVAPRVGGLRNDTALDGEGRSTFDIKFTAALPSGDGDVGLIVNVEAQGEMPTAYPLPNRAVYYCARLLSEQRGEVFTGSDYGKMRKVYSVWICLHAARGQENTISRYSFRREDVIGTINEDPKAYDLATIVMVRLGRPGSTDYTGILGLLGTLLAKDVPGAEKRRVLTDEYGVALTDELEDGVAIMGSLGECLYNEAREEGRAEGRAEGLAEGRAEGHAEGRAEGLAEGIKDGRIEAFAEVVAHVMASAGADETQAFEIAGVPEAYRAACLERMHASLASGDSVDDNVVVGGVRP